MTQFLSSNLKEEDKKVLVVARNVIFKNGHWQGLKTENLYYYLDLIKKNYLFKLRKEVEENPSWKQIIPYIIFNYQDKYFFYRYLEKAGEKRLVNNYQLGIGGHINFTDLKSANDIFEAAAMREWEEEIEYHGNLIEKKIIGILNDEKRPVEAAHLGLVYLFKGDRPNIYVKEKDVLEGKLVELKKVGKYLLNTSGWAPIVYKEYLEKFLND